MSKAFKGTINVDIRDSVPDWAHRRHHQAGGGRRQRHALRRPGAPSRRHARPGV